MRFLPDLLKTLAAQTVGDFAVLVVDNGSTDGLCDFLREQYPQIILLRNARNLGFSAAHNQAIRYALERWQGEDMSDRFVLVANPDLVLESDCLEKLMAATVAHPSVGAFGAKLRRAFGENQQDEALFETVKSDLLDSTGLRARKNRTVADRGAGEMDTGQYDDHPEVFGISAALALYRANALADVRLQNEFFDQDFFAYKEDVDLAWRLQSAGWDARFVPEAFAFHYRGMFGKERTGLFERIRNRRGKSTLRSFYSNRNQWLLLMKNEQIINGLLSLWRVLPLELARVLYTALCEPKNLRAFWDALRLFPCMMKKRRAIALQRKRSSRALRRWFV